MRPGKVRSAAWLSVLLACTATFSCHGPAPASPFNGWMLRPARFARFFQEWTKGSERLLITFGPGGTSDTTGIFQFSADGRFTHGPACAVRLKVPVARVAFRSTTHGPFLTALGLTDVVVGCAHPDRLRDTALVRRSKAGRIVEIANGDGLDRERLIALHPGVLFSYPYGTTGTVKLAPGTATVEVAEYLEQHPLGRAEWIKAFALFFGKERMADSLFNGIASRYDSAHLAVPPPIPRPVVFFGSSWRGKWSVPSGGSYMARMIADAGGRYLFAGRKAEGNIDIDLETALAQGARADFWGRVLDQDRPVTEADVAGGDARVLALPAFRLHQCFYANSAKTDLFGQALLEPDKVLRDLIGILHPELAHGRWPVYFKPVQ